MSSQEAVANDREARKDVDASEGEVAEGSQNDGSHGGGGGKARRPRPGELWRGGDLFQSEDGEVLDGGGDRRCGVVGGVSDVDARCCFHPMVPPVGWWRSHKPALAPRVVSCNVHALGDIKSVKHFK